MPADAAVPVGQHKAPEAANVLTSSRFIAVKLHISSEITLEREIRCLFSYNYAVNMLY